jgi:hypothetical protein
MSGPLSAKSLFGPLSRDYCVLFYYLSVIGLIFFFLVLVSGAGMLIMKKVPLTFAWHLVWVLVIYAVFYLQNRLLYNMCSGSMH